MTHIVRAIDIGYGNTKFTTGHRPGGEVDSKMFPSLAPQASRTGDLGAGMLAQRNTHRITVGGVLYEVGPDVALAQSGMARNRVMLADYCTTETYRALLYGALHAMNIDHVDLLALGLPVSTYATYKDELTRLATGLHSCDQRTVQVDHVRVYPQPLGGFFDYSVRSRLFSQMSQETNLMIDPGFYTLDWLMTQGIKVIDGRSGAANDGGMGSILRAICKAIAQDHDCDETELGDVSRIDAALRGLQPLRLFGHLVEVSAYKPIGLAKAEEAINTMMHTIGRTGDISNIVLVGGGSTFYAEPLKAKFPKHQIAVAHDPVFANVRGFQLIAEQRVAHIVSTPLRQTRAAAVN